MLRMISNTFSSFNLFTKIMLILLLISILPIFIIQIISYNISASTIEKQTNTLILANLRQSSNAVEGFFDVYDNLISDIYTDSSYIENLKYINLWDTKKYEIAKFKIEEKLENIMYIHSEILGIAVVGINGDGIFYDKVSHSSEESFCFNVDELRKHNMLKQSLEEKSTIYSGIQHATDDVYGDKNFMYIAHQLTDFNHYKNGPVGSVVLAIDESALRYVYASSVDFQSNITFVADKSGKILSFPSSKYVGKTLKLNESGTFEEATKDFFRVNQLMNSRKMVVHINPIREGEFMLVNIQDLTYALQDVQSISEILIIIGILFGWICLLIAMSFATSTNKAVKKIIRAMGKADQGDYNVQIESSGKDEFATISNHFNDMILRIKDSNLQEKDALLRKTNAEIRSLEAQINPHFLYNTLDAINWVAVEKEEYHISKMLVNLATILRYSIHKSNGIVMIREELDYLKRYIFLQHERFSYSFTYEIDMDESLADRKIHKLILQPLIENSIVHGFPGTTGQDEIRILIQKLADDYIQIQVVDNGKGMEDQVLQELNNYDYRNDTIETSIGIRNVITRLKLYYGSNSYFHIETDHIGTIVTLVLPLEY